MNIGYSQFNKIINVEHSEDSEENMCALRNIDI